MARYTWHTATNRLRDYAYRELTCAGRQIVRDIDELLHLEDSITLTASDVAKWFSIDRKTARVAFEAVRGSGLFIVEMLPNEAFTIRLHEPVGKKTNPRTNPQTNPPTNPQTSPHTDPQTSHKESANDAGFDDALLNKEKEKKERKKRDLGAEVVRIELKDREYVLFQSTVDGLSKSFPEVNMLELLSDLKFYLENLPEEKRPSSEGFIFYLRGAVKKKAAKIQVSPQSRPSSFPTAEEQLAIRDAIRAEEIKEMRLERERKQSHPQNQGSGIAQD